MYRGGRGVCLYRRWCECGGGRCVCGGRGVCVEVGDGCVWRKEKAVFECVSMCVCVEEGRGGV